MRARLLTVFLAAGLPTSLAAHESHSANFRNLSAGAGTSAASSPSAAPVAAPAPAATPRRPVQTVAASIVTAAPEPAPAPLPAPASDATGLWALSAAGAALAFAGAFLLTHRRSGGDSESIAMAAHELKSPLSAIEAYLALMEQDGRTGAADTRAWLEDVARMRTTAAHLRRTIGDMLEMTRLEDGRLRLEASAFDLGELARECARAYGALAQESGVTLSVSGDASAWGDPARTRQILDNLIGNALRFAPAGGSVTVTCASGPRPSVSVSDDGAGVPPERRDRLFTRFSRLSEPERGDAGTGLGLYIGRRLAEASGGRLEYAPGPKGRGSLFTLTLPGVSA